VVKKLARDHASIDRAVLYRKMFPLSRYLSFSSYIRAVERKSFFPFILYVEKISTRNHVRLAFQYRGYLLKTADYFSNWILLDKGTIKYSGTKNAIFLEASISTVSLVFYLLSFIAFIALGIWALSSARFTLDTFFPIILYLIVLTLIYKRDIKRFENIGLAATRLSKKEKRN